MVMLNDCDYKNNRIPIHVKCLICDHDWWVTYGTVRDSKYCPECANKKKGAYHKLSLKQVRKKIEVRDWTLYSKSYKNNRKSLKLKCPNNHKVLMNLDSFNNKNSNCQKCNKENKRLKYKIRFKKFLKKKNIKLLSKYVNADTIVKLLCNECDFEWKTTARCIKYTYGGCPDCNRGIFERTVIEVTRKVVKKIFGVEPKDYQQKTFRKLIGEGGKHLKFDYAIKIGDLKICVEAQGHQHYEEDSLWHKNIKGMTPEKHFKRQQTNDQRKRDYCNRKEMTLIEVPEEVFRSKDRNLYSYINKRVLKVA